MANLLTTTELGADPLPLKVSVTFLELREPVLVLKKACELMSTARFKALPSKNA